MADPTGGGGGGCRGQSCGKSWSASARRRATSHCRPPPTCAAGPEDEQACSTAAVAAAAAARARLRCRGGRVNRPHPLQLAESERQAEAAARDAARLQDTLDALIRARPRPRPRPRRARGAARPLACVVGRGGVGYGGAERAARSGQEDAVLQHVSGVEQSASAARARNAELEETLAMLRQSLSARRAQLAALQVGSVRRAAPPGPEPAVRARRRGGRGACAGR